MEPTNPESYRNTASHPNPGAQTAPEIRRCRRWKQRRRAANLTRAEEPRVDKETEDILEFIRTWAPYGGAPAEEILVRFGMTPSRFKAKLREIRALDHIAMEMERNV
ncbi:hypothetical protein [Rhodococcus opacus]|uniref:hypothetical protein n=1 Tax=Rhodococcus opacus TaxID=37919 RepID=UPI001009BD94|nr:hypothetical protein [Rhodococcus opacus]